MEIVIKLLNIANLRNYMLFVPRIGAARCACDAVRENEMLRSGGGVPGRSTGQQRAQGSHFASVAAVQRRECGQGAQRGGGGCRGAGYQGFRGHVKLARV